MERAWSPDDFVAYQERAETYDGCVQGGRVVSGEAEQSPHASPHTLPAGSSPRVRVEVEMEC